MIDSLYLNILNNVMMKVEFTYTETDDNTATISGLRFEDIVELIEEHNEYFETDYQSISEYNDSEPYRQILIDIKND